MCYLEWNDSGEILRRDGGWISHDTRLRDPEDPLLCDPCGTHIAEDPLLWDPCWAFSAARAAIRDSIDPGPDLDPPWAGISADFF